MLHYSCSLQPEVACPVTLHTVVVVSAVLPPTWHVASLSQCVQRRGELLKHLLHSLQEVLQQATEQDRTQGAHFVGRYIAGGRISCMCQLPSGLLC
jgi:hypothetical protein